jgi:hydrogenase maturation protease
MTSTLIAGLGNIFLGDDGFGVEVVRRLQERRGGSWPPGVRVLDCGIRGIDLYYALLDGVDLAILVDATHRDGPPGSVYVIEPSADEAAIANGPPVFVSPHELEPAKVLQAVRAEGATPERVVLVGCEPASFGTEDGEPGRIGLSDPVAEAVDEAVELIEAMLMQPAVVTHEAQDDARQASPEYRRAS